MTTRHPEYEHALPGYGSYKRGDAKDAKRRRPESSLEGYAQARGLEFLDTKNPNGYQGVVPGDSRLQFNVLRGKLPGGQEGILFHHVLAVPHDGSRGGAPGVTLSVYKPKIGLRGALAFIPFIGWVLEAALPPKDKRPDAIGVPTTEGAALVPEVATVPGFKCIESGANLRELLGSEKGLLDKFGVPGMSIAATGAVEPDPDFIERLMATRFADALRELSGRPYLRFGVAHGQLSIRVDGYLDDPPELDQLAEAVSAAANGLAEASAPIHEPRPFTDSLPDPRWPTQPSEAFNRDVPLPPSAWLPWLRAYAEQHGCTPEDPFAYHRAFPRLPVPGTAFVVMRLTPPGTATPARIAWHNERSILTHNTGCNAVLLPAAPGAPEVDRTRVQELGLQYAVADGIFSVWALRSWKTQEDGMGDIDGLLEQALRLAKDTGLAQL